MTNYTVPFIAVRCVQSSMLAGDGMTLKLSGRIVWSSGKRRLHNHPMSRNQVRRVDFANGTHQNCKNQVLDVAVVPLVLEFDDMAIGIELYCELCEHYPEDEEMTHGGEQQQKDLLTEREIEVLRLAADGLHNRDIAENLFLSPKTVKWHLSEIYSKLDVTGRVRAIARARDLQLLI